MQDFKNLLRRSYIAPKYHKIFYDFYIRHQNGERLIFIDGGGHAGVFSDVALACGGLCYTFEPNLYLHAFLKNQYKDNENLILSSAAIAHKAGKTIFYDSVGNVVSDGSGIMNLDWRESSDYEVDMIDFGEFVGEIITKEGKINFIKLDIEGAEFDVLDSLIASGAYKSVEYIMVETHERFFSNPKKKIAALRDKIKEKNITNIYLDWV